MSDHKLVPVRGSINTRTAERFGVKKAEAAREFHRTIPEYAETPLIKLDALAERLGLQAFYVKDESARFGLNAFKGLGGSFAMQALARGKTGKLSFVTATDGNHGRGVAWAAKRLGHEAHVFMPKGSSPERLENIRRQGAHAEITDLSYDDTVRYAASLAEENGWILLQDTAFPGYEEVPALIMQGYTTMGAEIVEQLGETVPTHIFLQAGVGAMAGAMTAFFTDAYRENKPTIVIVEPEGADCIFRTAEADDGALHFCGEDMHTIMAGLCCGEPCTIGWEQINANADFAVSCPDSTTEHGMRVYGHPEGNDPVIVSGESGAVTGGLVVELMTDADNADIKNTLGLDGNSIVLCISTEGDTDKASYRRIVSMPNER